MRRIDMPELNGQEHKANGSYRWAALFVVVIGTFMVMLDSSIVNIAIPKMMNVFGSSLDQSKWILTAYTLAMGSIVPITGFLSSTLGIKKLFIFALSIFTLGSFLCGLSWSNSSMVAFRVVQAIGGGMIMPVGMSYVMQMFEIHERGKALGFWGIASMAAPAIGPTLGGYVIQSMDWRFIFYINVPIGIIGVIFAGLLLKDTVHKQYQGDFDFIGFFSVVAGVVSILFVLGEGTGIDWSDVKFPLILAFGCFSLLIFVVNELTCPKPLLELRIFKIYDFTLSQIITGVTTLALMGGIYVLPLFLQNLRGYTAMEAGLILFPSAIASGLMMPISGTLFDKFGAKIVTIPGLIIVAFATYEMSLFSMDTPRTTITIVAAIRGMGMGFCMMPVNTAGMNAVPRHLFGEATALSTTVRSIMQALAITFMTSMISNRVDYNYTRLTEQITSFNSTSNYIIKVLQGVYAKSGLSASEAHGAALSTMGKMLYTQAYLNAMNYAILTTAVAVVGAILLVLMMSKHKRKEIKETKIDSGRKELIYESDAGTQPIMD
ncbi:MAG: DHA2 family efflux MFS transporter permease subunit [Dehalobacterium sp.]